MIPNQVLTHTLPTYEIFVYYTISGFPGGEMLRNQPLNTDISVEKGVFLWENTWKLVRIFLHEVLDKHFKVKRYGKNKTKQQQQQQQKTQISGWVIFYPIPTSIVCISGLSGNFSSQYSERWFGLGSTTLCQ